MSVLTPLELTHSLMCRLIVTVVENEAKGNISMTCFYTLLNFHATVDPPIPNPTDRTTRLRSQQEVRQLQLYAVTMHSRWLVASRSCLHPRPSSHIAPATHALERNRRLPSMALEEFAPHAPRHRRLQRTHNADCGVSRSRTDQGVSTLESHRSMP